VQVPQDRDTGVEEVIAALRAGRSVTGRPDGTTEIRPVPDDDPEEWARLGVFLRWLDSGTDEDFAAWYARNK
jgi:hypothetical protein